MMNNTGLTMMAAAALAGTAFGSIRTNTIVNGADDWTDPESFTDTSYAPGTSADAKDVVIIPENAAVKLDASGDPESLARVRNLGQILLASTNSRFEIEVDGDDEVDIPVPISGYRYVPNIDYQCGPVVKTGTGTLSLSSRVFYSKISALDYYTTFVVSNGTMKILQGFSPCTAASLGRVTVEEGAVFFLPFQDSGTGSSVYIKSLSGAGTVTNVVRTTVYFNGIAAAPYADHATFSGLFTGDVILRISNSETQSVTGQSMFPTNSIQLLSDTRMAKLGVGSFGNGKGAASSLGKLNSGASPELYFMQQGGGVEYLGEGENVTRGFVFYGATDADGFPVVVDAGANGGVTFTGQWQRQWTSAGGQNLVLAGNNAETCVLTNTISDNTTSSDVRGRGHSLYLSKEGTGTWRLEDRDRKHFASGISVDEGVLQYTTLAEAGEVCALGVATNLTDGTRGPDDTNTEHRVSYAVRLGGETVKGERKSSGRLEYVGEEIGMTSTREIAVAGAGGLRQNGPTRVMYRGGVYGISDGGMTLYLDGDSTEENVVKDVSDGAAGGRLSVVKEGTGNWYLEGDLTFTGDIAVKGGTLTMRKPTRYSWYRWTITSLYPAGASAPYLYWANAGTRRTRIEFHELGLFDSEGVNQAAHLKVGERDSCDDAYVDLPKGFARIQTSPGTSVSPQTTSVTVGGVTSNVVLSLERAFDEAYSGWSTWGVRYEFSEARRPAQDDPESWFSVVMRLRDGANEVVGLDFANVTGGWTSDWPCCISNFTVEASLDGVDWTVLTNVEAAAVHYDGGMWSCQGGYSDGEVTHGTKFANSFPNGTPHYKWYPLCGRPAALPVVNDPSGTVSVSGGGILRLEADDDATVTLSDIRVDASSGGTIDGFAFAGNGTLSVVNAAGDGRVDLPVSFVNSTGVSNISSWTLSVNGVQTARRKLKASGSGFALVPVGFNVIVR